MPRIVFTTYVHHSTYKALEHVHGEGNSWAEVFADAMRRLKERGITGHDDLMAVGLNNSRADWEALSGHAYPRTERFGSDEHGLAPLSHDDTH